MSMFVTQTFAMGTPYTWNQEFTAGLNSLMTTEEPQKISQKDYSKTF